MRRIPISIENEYTRGAGVVIGSAGSGRDVALEITFGDSWAGYNKRINWVDALGGNATLTILTSNLLESGTDNVYVVPVPYGPKSVPGEMLVTVQGYVLGDDEIESIQVTTTAAFKVLPSDWVLDDDDSVDPTVAEQLQDAIDDLSDRVVGGKIFIATFGVTSYDDVVEAFDAGKTVFAIEDGSVYLLTDAFLGTYFFNNIHCLSLPGATIRTLVLQDGSGWMGWDSMSIAPLNSPAFTGTPTAPTAAGGTNTTQLATTGFVQQEINNNTLFMRKGVDYVTAGQYEGSTIGDYATAEGTQATASGYAAHAEGDSTEASGSASHAEGNYTQATGDNSHSEGADTVASGNYAHAEGSETQASGYYSHAEGSETQASGYYSHSEGDSSIAESTSSHAEGSNTLASGSYSHAEGYTTRATGEAAHAENKATTATGQGSHAEGYLTTANHAYQHVFGVNNVLDDSAAAATSRGNYVEIVGNGVSSVPSNARTLDWDGNEVLAGKLTLGAAPEGDMDAATKKYVEDHYVTAGKMSGTILGEKATAEGINNTASAEYSHAEGRQNVASGYASHAEGYLTTASDQHSHAEGYKTEASGLGSHAENDHTTASGRSSHAEGERTVASGYLSHAEGYYTEANHKAQHVFGERNIPDPSTADAAVRGNYVEIVGNGTADNLSNARTLDWEGNEVLSGKLTIGKRGTNPMDVATVGEALNAYATDNASGAMASFSDGADSIPMKSFVASIEPVQVVKYDSPYPAGGGKNKLPKPTNGGTSAGRLYTVNADGSVTVTQTSTAQSLRAIMTTTLPAGTYIISGYLSNSTNNYGDIIIRQTSDTSILARGYTGSTEDTFTLSSDTEISVNLRSANAAGDSTTVTFYPMIRLSSVSDATFAPYSNVCPIYGHSGVKAVRAGVNLVPARTNRTPPSHSDVTYTINSDGSVSLSGTATATSYFVSGWNTAIEGYFLKAGTYYISGGSNAAKVYLGYRKADGSTSSSSRDSGSGVTVTFAEDVEVYIQIVVAKDTVTDGITVYPMISAQSGQAWTPYIGTTYPVTFVDGSTPLTVYKGSIDLVSGELTVTSATISYTSDGFNPHSSNRWYKGGGLPSGFDIVNRKQCISNQAEYEDAPNTYGALFGYGGAGIYINKLVASETFDEFSARLASTPFQVVYPLETPISYNLTPTEVLSLLGQNNCFNDCSNTEVEYRADTTLYIDKKLNA